MHSTKANTTLLSLAAVLAIAAGCVDENVAKPGEDPPPEPGPCGKGADDKDIKPVSVPVFAGGTGTPVIYETGKTPKSPSVFFTIPNPSTDPMKMGKPLAVAEGLAGEATFTAADFCPGKTYEVTAWLGDTFKDETKLGTITTPTVDAMKPFTIVGGGIVDKAAATKHGIVATTLYKLFVVDQTKFTMGKNQIIVVNASPRLGDATVDVNGTGPKPAPLFAQSEPIDVAVDPDPTKGKPVTLVFKSGDVEKTVTIGPRFPAGTQATAFLYDTVENDSMVKVEDADDPTSSMFVTADEILFSRLPATGVTFEVNEEE